MIDPHGVSQRGLRRAFESLEAPTDLTGDYRASYPGEVLPVIAPLGLGLVGLRNWHGKRFARREDGSWRAVNLVGAHRELTETLPMLVSREDSWADRLPVAVATYPADTRKPWPWVRDELRVWDGGVLLGMTFVDLPGARRAPGMPFVLTRESQ